MLTGKTALIRVTGRELQFHNQRHPGWTHPYPYQGHETLRTSGCGIFALCHAAQWLTGTAPDAPALADFSLSHGGRGDDGTDRPALLEALISHGRARELGFVCRDTALGNDREALYRFLLRGEGAALGNLRPGHIVCLLSARERRGHREILAIDSCGESAEPRVRPHVTAVEPFSAFRLPEGSEAFAAYWVDAALPRDFNLLHHWYPAKDIQGGR